MANNSIVLVCNDDGIASPGLRAAAEALDGLGRIMIVAPTRQQTGAGRGFHAHKGAKLERVPYRLGRRAAEAYKIDATPAMLMQHALAVLFLKRAPDIVVSGINYGENIGATLMCSGTIGAAMQAASHGVPALAMSLQTGVEYHMRYGDVDWTTARHFTRLFARKLMRRRLPEDVAVLNVNVPKGAGRAAAWRVTRVSRQAYYYIKMAKPAFSSLVSDAKVGVEIDHARLEKDSDIHALTRDKVVSVTPLSLDMTSRVGISRLGFALGRRHSQHL